MYIEGSMTSRSTIRFRWEEIRDRRYAEAVGGGAREGGYPRLVMFHICTHRDVPLDLCKKAVAQAIEERAEVVKAIFLHSIA